MFDPRASPPKPSLDTVGVPTNAQPGGYQHRWSEEGTQCDPRGVYMSVQRAAFGTSSHSNSRNRLQSLAIAYWAGGKGQLGRESWNIL